MPSHGKTSLVRKSLTVLGRISLTLGATALAAGAVVFGVGVLNDRAAAVPDPEAAALVPVEVAEVRFENSYFTPRRFFGQVEPRSNVAVSFELSGRLDALSVEEGETVSAGQEIARLDSDLLHAEATRLNAARSASVAQLVFSETRLERARELQKQGFSSRETFDQALAARDELTNRIAEIDAALQAVSINLQKSVLYAPISGQVSTQSADLSETVQAGQQIVAIVETQYPEVRVGLPLDVGSDDLEGITVKIDGREIDARLKRFRPDIDPVTRTRTALLELPAQTDVLFGQTASVILENEISARGAWVPLVALQSGTGSVWTVMVVEEGKLRRASVELLHVNGTQAYVWGSLSDGDQIVVSGAHRVVSGQSVHVLQSEG